ncbi:MAG TPA: DUF4440 domain-containing protein [Gemmatimonadaceae bacterium]
MRLPKIHGALRLALLSLVAACAPAHAGTASAAPDGAPRAEIAAMMERSAGAWNRGDLDAFVDDYLDSDRTTFVGRRGIIRGRAAIRQVYAPRFGPGGVRDSLSFEQLEVDPLAPGVAHVLAYYVLSRGDSVVARGPTSLVMLRVNGRWRIVHDHSS